MRNAGKVVSKTMILSHVWEYNFDPQTNIVDVLVAACARRSTGRSSKKLLQTVRGVGYVLRLSDRCVGRAYLRPAPRAVVRDALRRRRHR